jgi:hypothetical protein
MKRLFCVLTLFLLLVMWPLSEVLSAAATGSCTIAETTLGGADIYRITWVCTADGSGTFTTITASTATKGWVFAVDTTPGSTTPTPGTGFTLIASDSGADIMSGNASAMLGVTSGRAVPARSGWFNGTLRPTFTGAYTNNAIFTIRAWIWLQK